MRFSRKKNVQWEMHGEQNTQLCLFLLQPILSFLFFLLNFIIQAFKKAFSLIQQKKFTIISYYTKIQQIIHQSDGGGPAIDTSHTLETEGGSNSRPNSYLANVFTAQPLRLVVLLYSLFLMEEVPLRLFLAYKFLKGFLVFNLSLTQIILFL